MYASSETEREFLLTQNKVKHCFRDFKSVFCVILYCTISDEPQFQRPNFIVCKELYIKLTGYLKGLLVGIMHSDMGSDFGSRTH